MDCFLYFFSSGLAYFLGLLLLLPALYWRRRALVGGALAVAIGASVPTPLLLAVPGLLAAGVWLWLEGEEAPPRAGQARAILAAAAVLALGWELPYQLDPPPVAGGRARTIVVVGDSISAGLRHTERVWPGVLGQRRPVVSVAEAGATSGDALARQLPKVTGPAAIVVVEIGGNDLLLARRSAGEMARDLDALLAGLTAPGRVLYLLELPLPPLHHRFGAIQRRLARRHGARLIPRRRFARVLFAAGARSDGLHLSDAGHRAMADMIGGIVDGNP